MEKAEEINQKINKGLTASGKRKSAIAKAFIREGNGKVTINNVSYEHINNFHRLMIKEPVEIAKSILGGFNFDIDVRVAGGGTEGRIEASRLAIAKALAKFTKSQELRKAFLAYDKGLLVADIRRKEPYKPGDSKARSKRQKSYR
jgi:small subunit ribosomal protein S9